MLKSKTRWIVRQSDKDKADTLISELKISPIVASLLVNRGLDTPESAQDFLYGNNGEFHDPFLLAGMDAAVSRINKAINENEPILIYGDYDADGVTSTSVMMITLRSLGANVDFYIPNRFTEGYGPNEGAFRHAAEIGTKLLITVDTGISAVHEASIAKELGMDLIITDHHEPGPVLPEALAIIHPKLEGSLYPFRELAGVGVAFKVAHALLGNIPEELLEIAAIGTVADLVSLKGENRLLVQRGIKKLKVTKRAGLLALFKLANVEQAAVDEETIGFMLAPRLNAAGRLDSADPAVHLLLTDDREEAAMIAEEIDSMNKERQSIVSQIAEEAIKEVEEKYPAGENAVLVIGKEGWNAGVIGIVASRLVDKFYRPAIVLSFDKEKGTAKGSARSIAGFDLYKNLSACRDILPHFGGHPMAAGMTLGLGDVGELRERLNGLAKEQLSSEDFIPVASLDAEVSLEDVSLPAIEQMQLLSPFGMDNPKPRVLIKDAPIASMRKIGSGQNHLKMALGEGSSALDGIGFGLGELFHHISADSRISVIGELSINEWNNIRKPQIFLHDLSVAEWQLFDLRGIKRFEQLKELLPESSTKWICFDSQSREKFPSLPEDATFFISSETEAEALVIEEEHIVLADLPPSKQMLEKLLQGKAPARIYAHFYKEESEYFSTIPNRDHFKWFYSFLAKRGQFDIRKFGDQLAKHKGWSRETIDFMSKVFFELDFAKMENGLLALNKEANKRDLTESPTYQRKHAQYTLENDLLYSSYQELKSWFDAVLQGAVHTEEAMEEWI